MTKITCYRGNLTPEMQYLYNSLSKRAILFNDTLTRASSQEIYEPRLGRTYQNNGELLSNIDEDLFKEIYSEIENFNRAQEKADKKENLPNETKRLLKLILNNSK